MSESIERNRAAEIDPVQYLKEQLRSSREDADRYREALQAVAELWADVPTEYIHDTHLKVINALAAHDKTNS